MFLELVYKLAEGLFSKKKKKLTTGLTFWVFWGPNYGGLYFSLVFEFLDF
jgi:hypothetical protein